MFDPITYANCYLTPDKEKTKSCISTLEKRLQNSGRVFTQEELNENSYSFDVKLQLLKYQAMNGEPHPENLPAQTFKQMDLGDFDAISAQIAALIVFGNRKEAGRLVARTLAALNAKSKTKATGNATLLFSLQPKSSDKLYEYLLYNRIAIYSAFEDIEGLESFRASTPEILTESRTPMNAALAFLYAKIGEEKKLQQIIGAKKGEKYFADLKPVTLLTLSVASGDNGFSNLAKKLEEKALAKFCKSKIDLNDRWSVIRAKGFLEVYFTIQQVKSGKLPDWMIPRD